MADDESDKPLSAIELEDGEIEEDESAAIVTEPVAQIISDDGEDRDGVGTDRQQSFRKRHIKDNDCDTSGGWKKTRTDNSDREDDRKDGGSANVINERSRSPVETAKWGYNSDDEAQSRQPVTKAWGDDYEADSGVNKDDGSSGWGNSRSDGFNNNNRGWGGRNNDDDDDQRGGYSRNNDRRGRGGGRGRGGRFNNRGGRGGGRYNNDRGYNNNRNNSGWGNNDDDNNNGRGNGGWGNKNDDNGGYKRNNSGWGNDNDDNGGHKRNNSGWGGNSDSKSSWDNSNDNKSGWGSNNDDNKAKSREGSVEKWGGYNSDDNTATTTKNDDKIESTQKEPADMEMINSPVEKSAWTYNSDDDDNGAEKVKPASEKVDAPINQFSDSPVPTTASKWGAGSDNEDIGGWGKGERSNAATANKPGNNPSDKWKAESPKKSTWGNESPVKSSWGNESPKKSTWGNESPVKSSWGNESPKKSTWGNESPVKSSWGNESPKKSTWGNESPVKSSWGNECPKKSTWGNESPVKSSWGNESPKKSSWGNESPVKSSWGNDNENKGGWGSNNDNNNSGNNRSNWGGGARSYGGKRGVCKYFLMGSCRHGDNCKFLHENNAGGDSNQTGSDKSRQNNSWGNSDNDKRGGWGNNDNDKRNSNDGNSRGVGQNSGGGNNKFDSGTVKEATLKELCKFFEHHQCYKRSSCVYMHEEFPCKLYHAGSKMCPSGDSCKYSHAPLNDITKGALDKYLCDKGNDKAGFDKRSMSSDQSGHSQEDMMMDEQQRKVMSMYGPSMMGGQRCMQPGPSPMMHPQQQQWSGGRPPWSSMPHMMPYQGMNGRFMMDRYPGPGMMGAPGSAGGQYPPQPPSMPGQRMPTNQMYPSSAPHRPPIRPLMMMQPNGGMAPPYGMPPVGHGGPRYMNPPLPPLLNSPISIDESSKDGSTMQSQRQPHTDAYLDNLAHLVSKHDNNTNNNTTNNNNSCSSAITGSTPSHKRLVDILDPNSIPDDMDDFNKSQMDKSQLTLSANSSQISPIKTKSPEIAPGSYIPNNSLNAAVPNVRLNGDTNMMYNGSMVGNNGEAAMMDYINMSAFYYNAVPDPNQPHNQQMHHSNHNSMMMMDQREWKLLPLEFSQKVPYPLMMIDTSDVLNKFIDPRLQGHPSVMNPTCNSSSAGGPSHPPGSATAAQPCMSTGGNGVAGAINSVAGGAIKPTSVEIIDMTSGPDESPTYTTQISGNSVGTAASIESPLISPSSDIGSGAGGFPFSASVANVVTPNSGAVDLNKSTGTVNNARAYLQDPRFKRKKVASTPSVSNTSIETVELD